MIEPAGRALEREKGRLLVSGQIRGGYQDGGKRVSKTWKMCKQGQKGKRGNVA